MGEKIMREMISIIFIVLLLIGCTDSNDIRSPRKSIQKVEQFVFASGRWKVLPGTNSKIISKINFTSITCDHGSKVCEETTSLFRNPKEDTMYDNYMLFSQHFTYQITDWRDDTIKAKYEASVGDAEITISLKDNFAEKSWRETKARGSESSNPDIYGKWVLE
jgi:hypothetical protein